MSLFTTAGVPPFIATDASRFATANTDISPFDADVSCFARMNTSLFGAGVSWSSSTSTSRTVVLLRLCPLVLIYLY